MHKKEKYLIAIAGLLHDIGKFYQRATDKKTTDEDKKIFQYAHAYLSYEAINQELKEGLESVFSQEELKTILDGCYHHKPTTPIQHLLQKADWISSSERSKDQTIYNLEILSPDQKKKLENFAVQNPRLRSVFENLSLGKEYKKRNYFYKIAPLNLSKDIFPKDLEYTYGQIDTKAADEEEELGSYPKHWESFKTEFNQKLKNAVKFENSPEKIFSLIYHLLYKYLWCIPASTYDKENYSNHYPDISLFDHSRVLSAVACCFYDYDKEGFTQEGTNEFQNKFKDKEVFLHIKGDISGIQKFIYNVYAGKRGTAKTLRGRSFYVSLLPEILSRYILNQLEYPISNLLYSGGGIFEILVANTQENLDKILKIKQEIEEFLATDFEADLGLSLGYYQYSPIEMMKDYKTVLSKLNENLDNAKKEKFSTLIDSGKIFDLLNKKVSDIKQNKKRCPVCKTYLISENLQDDDEICEVCEKFRNIGQFLPKTEYLIFAKNLTPNFVENKKVVNFKKFGAVYLVDKNNISDLQPLFLDPEITEILAINDTSLKRYTTGFKFIGKVVPEAEKDAPLPEEDDKIEEGQIVPFSYLAQFSEGDDRIGILRMDVDNLGKLFSEGLKDKISISRIATLSRSLDLFFSGYLNEICKALTSEYKKQNQDANVKNFFYILYSGGDDVFLVAPWDKAIDIAEKINNEFKNYTCGNPNITLSAGYIQVKHKYPIRFAADLAGEAEEVAKSSGKDRICILGDVLQWNEIKELKSTSEKWIEYIKRNKLQRGFIYAVHRLKEQFLKDLNKSSKVAFPYREIGKEDLMFYPYAQYYIARNINKDIREEVSQFLLDKQNFKKLTFLVNYISLKTRN